MKQSLPAAIYHVSLKWEAEPSLQDQLQSGEVA